MIMVIIFINDSFSGARRRESTTSVPESDIAKDVFLFRCWLLDLVICSNTDSHTRPDTAGYFVSYQMRQCGSRGKFSGILNDLLANHLALFQSRQRDVRLID